MIKSDLRLFSMYDLRTRIYFIIIIYLKLIKKTRNASRSNSQCKK